MIKLIIRFSKNKTLFNSLCQFNKIKQTNYYQYNSLQQLINQNMGKDHQKILQLHSLLSKLLDSLCLEICVNKKDQNCTSLLQILLWRRKGEIDENQFIELYRSWLQSKAVFDLHSTKQIQSYPKNQFVALDLVQQNFMNISQINKALQMLNSAYNRLYLQKKPNNSNLIDQAEKIFSYLDTSGYIHLRLSSIFFFTGATVILQRYTVPLNYQAFKIHMNQLRKQLCEINGMCSLRSFKNYLLNLNSGRRTNYLDNIMATFSEMENMIGNNKNCMPNLFDDVFYKWKVFPRFNSTESKKNLQIYRRVFQENQKIFYDEGASLQYFLQKYGEQFVKCFQIDSSLLRQFNILLKQSLNKYIEMFTKVSHKIMQKNNDKNNINNANNTSNSVMTHRKKQTSQLQQPKLNSKLSSMKQKTPTKSQKTIDLKNTRTPTKTYNNQSKIRKQFGSTQKSKQKAQTRQLTPTKSFRQSNLYQSQAYTVAQKSAVKLGVQKDSFYNKMQFFKNKRVQSYEIVMKRLRGK